MMLGIPSGDVAGCAPTVSRVYDRAVTTTYTYDLNRTERNRETHVMDLSMLATSN
jgi:hypothetical protein